MSREIWKGMETKAREIRVGKTKGRRKEEGRGKETRGERAKNKEKETARSEEEAKQLVPEGFHKWIYVFGKKTSGRMPTRKLWDYTIHIKKGFVPRKEKVYPLLREEREKLYEFIPEQLRKGYIRYSKSSQMASVFFVGKKDRKKYMVQNYRYLNEWTVKNNYPLPLILDIIENIGIKRVFTKMDLR